MGANHSTVKHTAIPYKHRAVVSLYGIGAIVRQDITYWDERVRNAHVCKLYSHGVSYLAFRLKIDRFVRGFPQHSGGSTRVIGVEFYRRFLGRVR